MFRTMIFLPPLKVREALLLDNWVCRSPWHTYNPATGPWSLVPFQRSAITFAVFPHWRERCLPLPKEMIKWSSPWWKLTETLLGSEVGDTHHMRVKWVWPKHYTFPFILTLGMSLLNYQVFFFCILVKMDFFVFSFWYISSSHHDWPVNFEYLSCYVFHISQAKILALFPFFFFFFFKY